MSSKMSPQMSSGASSQSGNGGTPFFENLWRDVRYAVRTLWRDKGFATFAILIVGLGVGASCTIFSVVNTLLLRPLPFRDPERLVWIANHQDETNDMSGKTSQVDHLLDLREQNQSFEDMAAYFAFYGVGDAKLIGDGEPERLTSVPVIAEFFSAAGRGAADWKAVQRGGVQMERAASDDAERRAVEAKIRSGSEHCGTSAHRLTAGRSRWWECCRRRLIFRQFLRRAAGWICIEPFPLSPETNRLGEYARDRGTAEAGRECAKRTGGSQPCWAKQLQQAA